MFSEAYLAHPKYGNCYVSLESVPGKTKIDRSYFRNDPIQAILGRTLRKKKYKMNISIGPHQREMSIFERTPRIVSLKMLRDDNEEYPDRPSHPYIEVTPDNEDGHEAVFRNGIERVYLTPSEQHPGFRDADKIRWKYVALAPLVVAAFAMLAAIVGPILGRLVSSVISAVGLDAPLERIREREPNRITEFFRNVRFEISQRFDSLNIHVPPLFAEHPIISFVVATAVVAFLAQMLLPLYSNMWKQRWIRPDNEK
ncbi:hypothetical protein [Corynebacterium liangguodongii]|uniref:Uncharacterized protein n=1 Tax=Corynebacterium liangguodongii TaxID=2079535 RepID=A0A2S0WEV5_9CORY|nr:hypothetical protein [Corynebacterium liangguodongii]AWB84313.1 hypothetical protein C3E79_07325 [Corynebacterium liangguodongii]PWB99803.1 hypothetical protein DF219_03920 [Corynebacterium liangguodongii]